MNVALQRSVAIAVMAVAALVLPACALQSRATVAERSAPSPALARPSTYTVEKGDSLYAIAWRYQLDYRDLAAANNIEDPFTIYPGDVLNLPKAADERLRAASSTPARRGRATTARTQPSKPPQVAHAAQNAAKPSARTQATVTAPRPARAGATRGWRHPVGVRPVQAFGSGNLGQGYVLAPGARVYSASGGVVMYAGPGLGGYRHLVIVKASNQYLAAYGLNVAPVVREGEAVKAGQLLAAIDGDALSRRFHFEVRRDGKPVDPKPLIGS